MAREHALAQGPNVGFAEAARRRGMSGSSRAGGGGGGGGGGGAVGGRGRTNTRAMSDMCREQQEQHGAAGADVREEVRPLHRARTRTAAP